MPPVTVPFFTVAVPTTLIVAVPAFVFVKVLPPKSSVIFTFAGMVTFSVASAINVMVVSLLPAAVIASAKVAYSVSPILATLLERRETPPGGSSLLLPAISVSEYPPPAFMSVPLVFVPVSPWSVVLAAKAKGVSVMVMHSAKNAARIFRVMVHSSLICSVCFGSLSGAWVGPGLHPFVKMVAYPDSRGK